MQQETVDRANSDFWNELCGSSLARGLGIQDHSRASIERFDEAYLSFYPYLLDYIGVPKLRSARVLEIGLGYGTLSRVLAQKSAAYVGLDISAGPVNIVNESLKMYDLPGQAVQGSALEIPAESRSFDAVVSIGCLHHTGNLEKALSEVHRVLKPGGTAILMVYNGFSLRQWLGWPVDTLKRAIREMISATRSRDSFSSDERKAYDADSAGRAAPATEFSSKNFLSRYLKQIGFSSVDVNRMNCDEIYFRGRRVIPRKYALKFLAPFFGLDLYVTAKKETH